MVIYHNNR